ncbi:aminotransferase, class III [Trichodelitschia bisporula]|uniref:Aminotransferase, class III n=1 Tax=Trichodelitschia bisporula TaxID=703511 RepID=A0A6G1HJQ7_9PEZI|nr:aminotransferase, class III [Trichodelitschia bisporula]
MAVPSTHPPNLVPSHVLHRTLHHTPPVVTHASGSYITLSNGQTFLDATTGAAVACLGHGNARVRAAINKQLDSVAYCHSLFFGTSAAEELCAELAVGTGGKMTRALIVSSGSEATEAALKLARQYHLEKPNPESSRTLFISRDGSYHGNTLGALGASGHAGRRAIYEPLLAPGARVSACNAYRGRREGESDGEYVARLAAELDAKFKELGEGRVCAFVAETVVGAALGCVPPVPGYFPAIAAVVRKHGALLILDEVMSGMGRCGTLHAWQAEGVVPDIQTIGKGLGGGYAPVAGVLVNRSVVDVLTAGTGVFVHGQTYQAHPMACAAALEVQRIVREENLVANVARLGEGMGQRLRDKLADCRYVGDVRGRGFFWGIELVKDKTTKEPFDPALKIAMRIHEKGMEPEYSISVYPGTGTANGHTGDHVLLAPAFNITQAEMEHTVDLAARVVLEFFTALE